MTDNEIIKALECCIADTDDICRECPIYLDCINGKSDAFRLSLDLIARQKAEIKNLKQIAKHQQKTAQDRYFEIRRLAAEIDEYRKAEETAQKKFETANAEPTRDDVISLLAHIEWQKQTNKALMRTIADVQTVAVKEFAERLKERTSNKFWDGNKMHELKVPFVGVDDIDNLLKEKTKG